LEGDSHFRPLAERLGAAKFNAVFVNTDGFGGQFQLCLPGFNRHWLLKGIAIDELFCAHNLINNNTSERFVKFYNEKLFTTQ
jgi:hypothetical protein